MNVPWILWPQLLLCTLDPVAPGCHECTLDPVTSASCYCVPWILWPLAAMNVSWILWPQLAAIVYPGSCGPWLPWCALDPVAHLSLTIPLPLASMMCLNPMAPGSLVSPDLQLHPLHQLVAVARTTWLEECIWLCCTREQMLLYVDMRMYYSSLAWVSFHRDKKSQCLSLRNESGWTNLAPVSSYLFDCCSDMAVAVCQSVKTCRIGTINNTVTLVVKKW